MVHMRLGEENIPYPVQLNPQLPFKAGFVKLAPICLGADQKSFNDWGWLARTSPVGIRIVSVPIRWPP